MEQETYSRVDHLARKLLDKLDQAIGELDLAVITRKVKTREDGAEVTQEYQETAHGGMIDRAGLKLLTGLLKELQTIIGELPDPEGCSETATGVILLPERQDRVES